MTAEPYLDAGLDKFLFMLPKRYLNEAALWREVMEPTRSGPIGLSLIGGMHRSIAGLAVAGNNVIADHVLIDPRWLADAVTVLAPLQAYFIGIRCPLEVVEQRERDRKDSPREGGCATGPVPGRQARAHRLPCDGEGDPLETLRRAIHRRSSSVPVVGIASVWYPVSNWERAKRFYGEALGLRLLSADDQAGWAAFAAESSVPFFLVRQPAYDGDREGGVVSFKVTEADAMLERLIAAGARVGPTDLQPAIRNITVYDPDGNRFELTEAREE